jgi:HK97 family phage major capsid protein
MENLNPEQVVEKINTMISEKMAGVPTISDLNDVKSQVESLNGLTEKSVDIEKAIARIEGRMESMAEKSLNGGRVQTIAEKAIAELKNNVEMVKGGKNLILDIKADTTITGDYTGNVALSTLDTDVNRIARMQVKLRNEVNVGTTNSKFVTYIQQTLQSSGAFVAEAVAKTNGEVRYQEVSKEVKKVAGLIKVSKEMLSDLSFMQNEINTDLMATIEDQIESGILTGSGSGSNLEGMYTNATAWSAGTFANTIISANLADVIMTAVAQIETNKFTASHVVLHPRDVAKLQLSKTTTGEYTYPMFLLGMNGELRVANLIVVSTTWMTEGTFLVADMKKDNLRIRENMNITFGYDGDDFSRNMISIICEARLVNYIKANDTGAFVKGTIATAIIALDPAI